MCIDVQWLRDRPASAPSRYEQFDAKASPFEYGESKALSRSSETELRTIRSLRPERLTCRSGRPECRFGDRPMWVRDRPSNYPIAVPQKPSLRS